jgi:glycosyltransferase involved in cell wall biosynthesis
MRVALIDSTRLQFTTDTPYERPLGGSQSALSYLAVELARLGHAITVFNGWPTPVENRGGVQIRNFSETEAPGRLNSFDVVVVMNGAMARDLRLEHGVTVPLVLWTQHAHDQPGILALGRLGERRRWTGVAFVSNWQRDCYEKSFSIRREQSRVLRNAVAPAFAAMPRSEPWFASGTPPTLIYTSTPFRGLDVLLRAFPQIRAAVPGTRLRVFSSMSVYQVRPEDDRWRELYSQCQSMDGVDYVGSIGQARLAEELAGAAALAYPSTFAETSCISVLEAMACGAAVLTTRLGVLPETTNGFAAMVDCQEDATALAQSFAAMTIAELRHARDNPEQAAAQRDQRIKFIHDHYLWPARAKEWSEWLSQLSTR